MGKRKSRSRSKKQTRNSKQHVLSGKLSRASDRIDSKFGTTTILPKV